VGLLRTGEEAPALAERLDAIAPVLRDGAEAGEQRGRLTDEVVAALRASGAFLASVPRELGGYELAPRQQIEVIERVSRADASAGWAYMAVQIATGTTAAYLGPEAVRELYPDVPGGEHALVAGQGTKPGTAVRVDGGYRISGHWHFASGVPMASHVHTAAHCAETGESLICTLPVEQVQLVDNWDVLGLRATASHDYVCEDVFVPEHRTNPTIGAPVHLGGALYRLGMPNMSGICHTGWALGLGRRILDELRELTAAKTGASGAAVDTDEFHAAYAHAEALLRSARAWAMEVWADVEASLDSGTPLSTEQETLIRLSLHHATRSVHEIGQTAYKWAATAALRRGPLQRCFRDLHAGTQHVTCGPVVQQQCGKWLAGLAPDAEWVFLSLRG